MAKGESFLKLAKKPLKGVKTFLQNLRDSFRFSLRKTHKTAQELQTTRQLSDELLIETILYELPNSGIKRPVVKTAEETIREVITSGKNIVRYGDGEVEILNGGGIPFQKADEKLTQRLREILNNEDENLLVAIDRRYYQASALAAILREKNPALRQFELYTIPKIRQILNEHINFERVYYEACITGAQEANLVAFREFFAGKKLVLVGCKEAFESYKFNIFDTASELRYEFVPNKHAFSAYDDILPRLLGYDASWTRILMCGPAAKVFVADLTKAGFRALDLGHLAKSYDWFKKGISIYESSQNAVKFFAPDE